MKRNKEAGQALVLTAVALVVLMGFAGLAIDMGVLRYEKRLQQTAADAAAIAGANNLAYGGVTIGAQNAAATNGFTDNGGGQVSNCSTSTNPPAAVGTVCVQINNPPCGTACGGPIDGPHNGDPNYVEVLVAEVHSTYFMKVLGINSEAITARAVATDLSGGANSGCLYTLGPPSSSIEGVNINGSAVLNATTCGIVDNGDFNTKGNKLIVNAGTFGESGNTNASGPGGTVTCTVTPNSCPTPNMPASGNPLGYLTPPCSPCTGGGSISINGNGNFSGSGVTYNNGVYTISPGTYNSISISGTGGGNTVVFSPGLYIIDGSGGMTIPGNATISCGSGCGSGTTGTAGVTFYFTGQATINVTGTPNIQLSAGTSQYPGILMYQDPADTNTTGPALGGNNSSFFTGALYFPSDQLTFYGNNTSYSVGMVVSDSINLSGNPTVNLTGNVGLGPGVSLIKNAVLVE
ncbi:MAG TPA: pilus assembly protein TadG-related protein [Candidatus Acidoferrales bacterium]|nr:pilus assembly protein TadG-related protein [Candidatus Acidoferrales bacterium]